MSVPMVFESGFKIKTLGDLKAFIALAEKSGATDEAPVWIAGNIKLTGKQEHMDPDQLLQVNSTEIAANEIIVKQWPQCPYFILHFLGTCDIPDPDDGPFI